VVFSIPISSNYKCINGTDSCGAGSLHSLINQALFMHNYVLRIWFGYSANKTAVHLHKATVINELLEITELAPSATRKIAPYLK
jgi:hypothetical protein